MLLPHGQSLVTRLLRLLLVFVRRLDISLQAIDLCLDLPPILLSHSVRPFAETVFDIFNYGLLTRVVVAVVGGASIVGASTGAGLRRAPGALVVGCSKGSSYCKHDKTLFVEHQARVGATQ